jgi:hypothetical protein
VCQIMGGTRRAGQGAPPGSDPSEFPVPRGINAPDETGSEFSPFTTVELSHVWQTKLVGTAKIQQESPSPSGSRPYSCTLQLTLGT